MGNPRTNVIFNQMEYELKAFTLLLLPEGGAESVPRRKKKQT